MRIMGLDVGTKTVGVAISDELGMTAQAITTVRRKNLRTDLAELRALVAEYGVEQAIVGLPLNMDGSEGPRAQASREFAQKLEADAGVATVLWDERLSTVAAQRVLLEADLSREKRKKVVDQVAATFILQGWLDSRQPHQPYNDNDDDDEGESP